MRHIGITDAVVGTTVPPSNDFIAEFPKLRGINISLINCKQIAGAWVRCEPIGNSLSFLPMIGVIRKGGDFTSDRLWVWWPLVLNSTGKLVVYVSDVVRAVRSKDLVNGLFIARALAHRFNPVIFCTTVDIFGETIGDFETRYKLNHRLYNLSCLQNVGIYNPFAPQC